MAAPNSGPSLSAQTSPGAGAAITFTSVCKDHGQQVNVTGWAGSGQARVVTEVSLDDANWFPAASVAVNGNGSYYVKTEHPGGGFPALYARGRLASVDPTVTALSVSSVLASE